MALDPSTLIAAMDGIKRATQLVGALVRADVTLERADLKVKLADVMGELAEARTVLVGAREQIEEAQQEIRRLQDAVRLKDQVERFGDVYFSKAINGSLSGDPYCSYCFEEAGRLFHLTDRKSDHLRVCPHCKHEVDFRRSDLPDPRLERPR